MQRTSEWLDNVDYYYHEKQFKIPNKVTINLCEWLEQKRILDRDSSIKILDLCCGEGANLAYMKRLYPRVKLTGVELNPELVKRGNGYFGINAINDISIETGDIFDLRDTYKGKFDGLISFQTLSWLPNFREPIEVMCGIEPKWIALSSLFFDGLVSYDIESCDYSKDFSPQKRLYYNIYSIPVVRDYFKKLGYDIFSYKPFEINIDIPDNHIGRRGTYTLRLDNGGRIQVSGGLMTPWYFILAEKSK